MERVSLDYMTRNNLLSDTSRKNDILNNKDVFNNFS